MDLTAFLRGESVILPGRGLAGLTEAPPRKPLAIAATKEIIVRSADWSSQVCVTSERHR